MRYGAQLLRASLPLLIALTACAQHPESRAAADSSPAGGTGGLADSARAPADTAVGPARPAGTMADSASARPGGAASPSRDSGAPSGNRSAEQVELSGRVVNSGTDRFAITTLQVENSRPTRLVGDLRSELRTLGGAEVRVRGVIDSAGRGRALRVQEYELLSIDGKRPRVGRVLVRDSGLWLAASDTVRLVPELAALRDRAGAKIWVVGTSDPGGTELRVESYGVIAPAP